MIISYPGRSARWSIHLVTVWTTVRIYLQSSGSLEVSEELDDVRRHRGRSGEMIAWWLETVLIGDPVDSDDLSFRRRVRVRSARNDAGIFGFGSDLFQVAALLNLDAIASLEAEMNIRNILFSQLKILSENKRPTLLYPWTMWMWKCVPAAAAFNSSYRWLVKPNNYLVLKLPAPSCSIVWRTMGMGGVVWAAARATKTAKATITC